MPPRFCATVFADSIGAARHLVVASNGDVFVALQTARRNSRVAAIPPGAIGLRDTNGDGVADLQQRFGSAGGTGIALHGDFLYADVGPAIVRYPMPAGALTPTGAPDTVVKGMPYMPGHSARNFAIARDGSLYVNIGSQTNACQERDRQAASPGINPCTELERRAGIWRFDANRLGQEFMPAARFATGIRNATGLAINPADGSLYAASHGRDNLSSNWAGLFTEQQNAELPAEELFRVTSGDDFGWPYCYWDGPRRMRVLAPEYGGNGATVGQCSTKKTNVSAMPAHWAPNALMFYTGSMFPARYRGGAFIAFHGSWNRAPLPQGGYNVVFLPFANGASSGSWEVFATGFVPADVQPATAPHRPAGVAQGPDGALYVTDDVGGRVWRITYRR
ncbi:MAG TPA: PQQ-dependent sugar dehydrogenase [Gemmatimonadaceae bacterium]|nr:PQQ-dependent sugar dehydrogenase [Gemmatimonadaceae bacterium]